MLEGGNRLRRSVFKDVEIVLREVIDEVIIPIQNGRIQYDFIDVAAEGKTALLAMFERGPGLGRIGIRWADWLIIGSVGRDNRVAVDGQRWLLFRRGRCLLRRRSSLLRRINWSSRLRPDCNRTREEEKKKKNRPLIAMAHSIRYEHEQ